MYFFLRVGGQRQERRKKRKGEEKEREERRGGEARGREEKRESSYMCRGQVGSVRKWAKGNVIKIYCMTELNKKESYKK